MFKFLLRSQGIYNQNFLVQTELPWKDIFSITQMKHSK